MFFDWKDGQLGFPISDHFAMNTNGDFLLRLGKHFSLDLNSGDVHLTSAWKKKQEQNGEEDE